MKRTTIITISAIVFGFVFWSTLPGLLSSVKTKTLSIDDTETINLKDLTSLTFLMKPGAEDDYEEEGLFGDYTFDITIRVDDHAKGVRITYPKDLITAQTEGVTGKRNGSDISLRFARKFKDFVTEGGGQIISQNKKYGGFQEKDEMLNAYTISDIPVTIVMPTEKLMTLLSDNDSPKGKRLRLHTAYTLTIENLNSENFNFADSLSLSLVNCNIRKAHIAVMERCLTLDNTRIGDLTFEVYTEEEQYTSSTLSTTGKSSVEHVTVNGTGDLSLDHQTFKSITAIPSSGTLLNITLEGISEETNIKGTAQNTWNNEKSTNNTCERPYKKPKQPAKKVKSPLGR